MRRLYPWLVISCIALAFGSHPVNAQTTIALTLTSNDTPDGLLGPGFFFAADGSGGLTLKIGAQGFNGINHQFVGGQTVDGTVTDGKANDLEFSVHVTGPLTLTSSGNGVFTANPAQLQGSVLLLGTGPSEITLTGTLTSLTFSEPAGYQPGNEAIQFTAAGTGSSSGSTVTADGFLLIGGQIYSPNPYEFLSTLAAAPNGTNGDSNIETTPSLLPEPSSVWLLGTGMLAMAMLLRRRAHGLST